MTFATICTGIGGFDLGFERAGLKPLWFCEIDRDCQKILRKQWPDTPIENDLTQIDSTKVQRPDVLAGGTPCVGFSVAGKRECLSDPRSALALNYVRLCDELDPDFIVWENVPGVLSTPDNSFGAFLACLVGADAPLLPPGTIPRWNGKNFRWTDAGVVVGPKRILAWRVFDSQHFGLAQRRERVFVVASPRRTGLDPSKILFEPKGLCGNSQKSRETRQDTSRNAGESPEGSGGHIADLASSLTTQTGKGGEKNPFSSRTQLIAGTLMAETFNRGQSSPDNAQANHIVDGTLGAHKSGGWGNELDNSGAFIPDIVGALSDGAHHGGGLNGQDAYTGRVFSAGTGVRRLTPTECARLSGFPDDWCREGIDEKGRVVKISDSAQYRAWGNCVNAPVAEWIGRKLIATSDSPL